MRTTVVLADDQTVVLEGVRLLLEARAHVKVVATASNSDDALEKVRATGPDVVVMEFSLPDAGGVETTRAVREASPGTRVMILAQSTSTDSVAQALQAGASGYVAKSASGNELIEAVRTVASGGRYLSAEISLALSDAYVSALSNPLELLSAREREVLQLIVEGVSSPTIAQKLGLSANTVDTYRSRVKAKLGIESTADLVKFAIRHQLTAVD
jgi:DNA-binding NarL/FixJ family response regulator